VSRARTGRAPLAALLTWLAAVVGLSLAAVVLAFPAPASADNCPNAVFRNGPSSRLPDCRAYEMVTPPYKQGFRVEPLATGEDGLRVAGGSLGNFAGTESDAVNLAYFNNGLGSLALGGYYTFSRGESGWTTAAVGLPVSRYIYPDTFQFNPDLTESLSVAVPPAQRQAVESAGRTFPANYPSSFYVRDANGPVAEVGPVAPLSVSPSQEDHTYFFFAGASADLSHVLFGLTEDLWPGDETEAGANSLYEYVGAGNAAPLLVGVSGGPGSTSLIGTCGTELGSQAFRGTAPEGNTRGAVSSNGAIVYFTALACGQSPPVSEIFARVDGGQPDAHTVAISEPSTEDCSACDTEAAALASASFVAGSSDGSKVFFTTTQPLLGADISDNLYEYDSDNEAGQRIVRVSGGDPTVVDPVAGVENVLSVSRDGSHVYFTASGVLTEIPNSLGEKARPGQSNLYLYERDSQYPNGRTVFILPSAVTRPVNPGGGSLREEIDEGTFEIPIEAPEVSVSQNGRFLVFGSYAHLTTDTLGPAEQGFEYDSQTGDFVRITIGQNGFNDDGNAMSEVATESIFHKMMVANDGAVFFQSTNSLVPQAVSGQPELYEYREGNVSLISDGQSTSGSNLVSITASGGDVFFETQDRLVPRDTDDQSDIYDARVDGGFSEPPPPPPCEGDACQGALGGAPVLLSPGSEFQAGGENVVSSAVAASEASRAATKAKIKPKTKSKPKPKRKRRERRGGRLHASKADRGVHGAGVTGGRR
jgi:hypothetical protein